MQKHFDFSNVSVYFVVSVVSLISYVAVSLWMIQQHEKEIEELQSKVENLRIGEGRQEEQINNLEKRRQW